MSKKDKLVERLLSVPKDFKWDELVKVLSCFRYKELKNGKTGGSRRKFINENNDVVILHKPHPHPEVKEYALQQVITHLKDKGYV